MLHWQGLASPLLCCDLYSAQTVNLALLCGRGPQGGPREAHGVPGCMLAQLGGDPTAHHAYEPALEARQMSCKVALLATLVPTSSQTNVGRDGPARTTYQMSWHRANSFIDAQFFSIYIHVYKHCPLTRMRVPNPHHLGGVRAANTHKPMQGLDSADPLLPARGTKFGLRAGAELGARTWARRIHGSRGWARSSGPGPGSNFGLVPGPSGFPRLLAGPELGPGAGPRPRARPPPWRTISQLRRVPEGHNDPAGGNRMNFEVYTDAFPGRVYFRGPCADPYILGRALLFMSRGPHKFRGPV